MRFDFIVSAIFFALSSVMGILAIVLLFRKERIGAIRLYSALSFLCALYLLGEGIFLLADTETVMMRLMHLQYMIIPFSAVLWFWIAYQFTHPLVKIPKWLIILPLVTSSLFVISNLFYSIPFMGALQALFFQGHQLVNHQGVSEGYNTLVFDKGIMYYLMIVSMSFFGFISFIQYYSLRQHVNKATRYKGLFLSIFSIAVTLFTIYGLASSKTQLFDFSAFVLSGFTLLAFFVSYRQELLDLVPKAYKMAFENEQVPLLILDKAYTIIRTNLATRSIFPTHFRENQSIHLADLFKESPAIYKELINNRSVEYEINNRQFFDVKLKELHIRDTRLLGYLISMQDITHHKIALKRMENIASIDELTNIYNRRYFFKEATRLFDEAVSKHQIMSIIMFDLDQFKDVNDIYGHQAGDYVLEEMARQFSSILDSSDIFARYGGEEFIIYRPSKNVSDSKLLATKLCQYLHEYEFHFQDRVIKVSASFGVSGTSKVIDNSLEQYIKIADVALYKAKTKGKNRVECG